MDFNIKLKENNEKENKNKNELKNNNISHNNEKQKKINNSNLSLSEANIDNFSNPKDIQFLRYITKDSYTSKIYDNAFSVFKSINNIFYLIYGNENNSIISLNLNNNQKINEIKNAHNETIINFRHYLDDINKRDLLLSISNDFSNNNIKLWNINNWECLLSLEKIYKKDNLLATFLISNNENYITTCNYRIYKDENTEPIKILDFKGNQIKIINDSNENTYFIDVYYDKNLLKNYIITGNEGHIKSYDYNSNIVYHKYCDKNRDKGICFSSIIIKDINIIKIISSFNNGFIKIWNFHNENLLNKIKICNKLLGICLWNNEFLFAGSSDKTIKLIDLNEEKVIREFNGHNQEVTTIKKIFHPNYGECLISYGIENIILWKNNHN